MRDLADWLAWQERNYPRVIDLGLERLGAVLARIGWVQPQVPVVTVAGTNGKGSVSAYVHAIAQAAGLRAGLFTSPHLRDYRERLRVGPQFVSAAQLVDAFERIETARGDIGLTFFEYNTLAALMIFAQAKLDLWVLEIGLGGRLDAVNIVDPDVAVVVSIGLDHQEYLGHTLQAIGVEKAGIFRTGRPAVLGHPDLPDSVSRTALERGALLKRPGLEFTHSPLESGRWSYRGPRWSLSLHEPSMFGPTQLDNAATAIAALEALGTRLSLPPEAIDRGLASVRLPGRFQVIDPPGGGPRWILDVAHNPAAAAVLARNLHLLPAAGRTLAVFGMLSDKDPGSVVAALEGEIDHWYLASTDGPRGLDAPHLMQRVGAQIGRRHTCGGTLAETCALARSHAAPADRIVAFGSFHSVAPVLDWLEAQGLKPTEPTMA